MREKTRETHRTDAGLEKMCFRIKERRRTAKPILMLLQLSARRSAGSGERLREKTGTILGRSVRKQRSCVVVCVFSQYLGGRGRQIHREPQAGRSYIVRPCLRQAERENLRGKGNQGMISVPTTYT